MSVRQAFRGIRPLIARGRGGAAASSLLRSYRPSMVASVRAAGFSSHPDFAPQSKVTLESSSEVFAFIDKAVKDHKVMLFMKGTPEFPRCGFSAQVVRALKEQGADFSSADVLTSDELREGVKQYTDWPTIPQLYVNGEFVGGCDVVLEMEQSGDLAEVIASTEEN